MGLSLPYTLDMFALIRILNVCVLSLFSHISQGGVFQDFYAITDTELGQLVKVCIVFY